MENKETRKKIDIRINEKAALTIREAAAYSNIGVNKLEELTSSPICPFVFRIGRKKLIKREAFDEFIRKATDL